ncbi:VCBS domain-containing protein [Mesorhizobium sp. Z1-4]|uniref:VCBS domain-containing protein n=2 Tax=Mesorhizobium sp. Z1-4 TaxID=2448478 RepID=UPI0019822BAD|nr:VCBS domain-containing protein [Mesorhizobium sp. Z1-4]
MATDLSVLETDGSQLATVFAAVEAELGDAAQAIAAIWDYLDDNYVNGGPTQDPINEAFIRLGAVYAQLVKDGTITPLVDVMAKFTPDDNDGNSTPERAQNLHDNLLGNVTSASIAQRFGGDALLGNVTSASIAQRFGGDALEATLTTLVTDVDPALLTRPYFSGNEGADQTAVRAWDAANGYVPMATGQLTASDVDAGETAQLEWSGDAPGTYGSFAIDVNTGEWTYKLDNSLPATQALKAGQTETEVFTVTVTDPNGATDTIDVTITVTGANDAPVTTGDVAGSVIEGGNPLGIQGADITGNLEPTIALNAAVNAALDGLQTAPDDVNDVLATIQTQIGADVAQAISVVWDYLDDAYVGAGPNQPNINEAFVRLGAAYAEYLRAGGQPLTDVIAKFDADDGDGNTTPERMQSLHDNLLGNLIGTVIESRFADPLETILKDLVSGIDAALLTRPYFGGYEGEADAPARNWDVANGFAAPAVSGQLTANDVDTGETGSLIWDAGATAGALGIFTVDALGGWTYELNQGAADALDAGDSQVETFTVTVTDINGAIDTATVTITVVGTNDAPHALALSATQIPAGNAAGFRVGELAVSDVDDDSGFTFDVAVPGFTVVEAGGQYFLETTAPITELPPSVAVTVTDDNGASFVANFVITLPVQLFAPDQTTLLGSYSTIKAAVDAAAVDGRDGLLVDIGAGTYAEDVTATGQALILRGNGAVTIEGEVTVAGELNNEFRIENVTVNAAGNEHGINVTANSSNQANSGVVLNGVVVHGAQHSGFAYIRAGNESAPTLVDTIGSISILNSEFFGNATVNSGSNGRGDILLFGFNGNFTIDNVDIHDPAIGAQKAIQVRGLQDGGDTPGIGLYDAAGTFSFNDLTISGSYHQDLIAFYRIAEFASFTTSNVDLNASAPWGLINFDSVGGVIDISTGFVALANGSGVVGVLQGLATNDTLTGTSGGDRILGRGGDDTIDGQGGDDTIIWRVGDGNDQIDGGSNAAVGDTLVVASTAPGQTITLTAPGGGGFTVAAGGHTVTVENVEEVVVDFSAGAGTLNVVGDFAGSGINVNTITVEGGAADDTVDASAMSGTDPSSKVGIDFSGNGGNDTFISGVGDDYFDGGEGTDSHQFGGNISNYTVILNADGTATITDDVGNDGVDTSSETVERIVFNDVVLDLTMAVRLFDANDDSLLGTFDSIDDAINAVAGQSASDLRIEVDGSIYATTESLDVAGSDINGKDVTILGNGAVTIGESTGDAIVLSGDFGGGSLSFENVTIDGGHNGISANGTVINLSELKLTGVTVTGNANHGLYFFETRDGVAQLTIEGGTFTGNGGFDNNTAHIKLFGFSGDADFTGGLMLVGAGNTPAYGIEITGGTQGGNANPVPANEPAIGAVSFDGVELGGGFAKNAVALFNFLNLNGLDILDLDLSSAHTGWGPLFNIDGIAASYDASGFNIIYPAGAPGDAPPPANGIVAELQGDKPGQNPVNNTITGGDANERLIGKEGNDTLIGGGGDDEIFGHYKNGADEPGNDTLIGGAGNDRMFGGAGDDTFVLITSNFDNGLDHFDGGEGHDRIVGGWSIDVLNVTNNLSNLVSIEEIDGASNTGHNTILATSGNDTLDFSGIVVKQFIIDGADGDDTITGTNANDTIRGGAGNDTLNGLGGDDTFLLVTSNFDNGVDQYDGGAGHDRIVGGWSIDVLNVTNNLANLAGIEELDGGDGTLDRNTIKATAGNDTLNFSGMIVTNFTIDGGGGNDNITGTSAGDRIRGGEGNDTITGGAGNDTLFGNDGNDTFVLLTSNFDNGVDHYDGGAGYDRIVGGWSHDTLNVTNNLSNLVSIEELDGAGSSNTILATAGDDTLNFTSIVVKNFTIDGGAGNDTITGTNLADTIRGGAGNDSLNGLAGDDIFLLNTGGDLSGIDQYDGGAGHDQIVGGWSIDVLNVTNNLSNLVSIEEIDGGDSTLDRNTILATSGNDTLDFSGLTVTRFTIDGGAGDDIITGTSGADRIRGGADNDTINGGSGDDTIFGNGGDDVLIGGSGLNTFEGGSGSDVFVIDPSALSEVGMIDVITDYDKLEGDTLDLGSLLEAALGSAPADAAAADAAVNLVVNGGNTDVVVDTNGAAPAGEIVIAQLTGVHSTINILYDGSNDTDIS